MTSQILQGNNLVSWVAQVFAIASLGAVLPVVFRIRQYSASEDTAYLRPPGAYGLPGSANDSTLAAPGGLFGHRAL
jgi:hypothetical protein